jgi:hypothetical protein
MITGTVLLLLLQSAAINGQRDSYLSCLEQQAKAATAQKVAAETVEATLRQACAPAEKSFKSALVAFDVKNKVPRKQAAADAQLQVDDFVTSTVERYKSGRIK